MNVALLRVGGFALLLSVFLFGTDAVSTAPAGAVPDSTTRVSVPNLADQGTLGTQGNGRSISPGISDDGRFVVFLSTASNLVPNDTNGSEDVFVHDRQTGTTEAVSVDAAGAPAGGALWGAAGISGDGRFVVFGSTASNLVLGDTNGKRDIFVRDRQTGTTERVSVNSAEGQANDDSWYGYISDGGRFVTFVSHASSLDGDIFSDVFIRDRQAGTTQLISTAGTDAAGGEISGDGRYIVYKCCLLVGGPVPPPPPTVYLYDRLAASSTTILSGTDATGGVPSDDGRYIAFDTNTSNPSLGDSNNSRDVYLYDTQTQATELISKNAAGTAGDNSSSRPSISGDGRFVSFTSNATNLLPEDPYVDTDIFVRDRQTGTTAIVSINNLGGQSVTFYSGSDYSAIDDAGSIVAFDYTSCELIVGDTNGVSDIYVHDAGGSGGLPPDADCDTVTDAGDNCPLNANPLQENNVHPGTAAGDHCEDPDGDLDFDIADNCPDTANPTQTNTDGDSMGDACDSDDDDDGIGDTVETPCGSDPLDVTPPLSRPERLDGIFAGVDDDGDAAVDEALPPGAAAFDCDGDGYKGSAEAGTPLCDGLNNDDRLYPAYPGPQVADDAVVDDGCPGGPAVAGAFSEATFQIGTTDQDPCGTSAWPSDIVSGGIPDSTNNVNIYEVTGFIAPRRLDTSPGHPGYDKRWDLQPGRGVFNNWINATDIATLISGDTGYPPMLAGAKAFSGPSCPWP